MRTDSPTSIGNPAKMRILVVDDDVNQLRSIRRYLNAAGLSVITCSCTAEAITALECIPIDSVLSDIQMPGDSGFTLIRWIDTHLPNIPVFAMTAYGSDEIYQDVLRHGAVVYLEKPVDLKLLVQLLVSSKDSCRHSSCFVSACLEAAATKGSGEVVAHNQNRIGQFFFYEGKIAWAAVQNNSLSFVEALVTEKHLNRMVVANLIQECKTQNLDFFVELVRRQLLSESTLTDIVKGYISSCFAQCLQWEDAKAMYIANTRPYKGRLLYDLADILTWANESQTWTSQIPGQQKQVQSQ